MLGFHSKDRIGCGESPTKGGGSSADRPEKLLVERGEVWFVDVKLGGRRWSGPGWPFGPDRVLVSTGPVVFNLSLSKRRIIEEFLSGHRDLDWAKVRARRSFPAM
jgi:hypothetical protein